MLDLKRVQYIAANYYYLQGLKIVPLGIIFVVWAAMRGGLIQSNEWIYEFLSVWGFAIGFGLYGFIQLFYDRVYGRAGFEMCLPEPGKRLASFARMTAIVVALIGAAMLDQWLQPPVLLFGLTIAGLMLVYYWPRRDFAMHYMIMALLIAAASLLPLISMLTGDGSLKPAVASFAMVGLVFIVGGILDHLLLVRTMRPVSEARDGNAI